MVRNISNFVLPYSDASKADNTCHFGINSMFADNGLSDTNSYLYFPADALQMVAVVKRVFFERGIRFVFSTRSKVPYILKPDGKTKFFGDDYEFVPGKDEVIVDGKAGYVVSFGEMLYRAYDAVLRAREAGIDVGLINKPSLHSIDEEVCFISSYSFQAMVFKLSPGHHQDRQEPLRAHRRVVQPEDWPWVQVWHIPASARSHSALRVHGNHQRGSVPLPFCVFRPADLG